jgi:hypothetical protein
MDFPKHKITAPEPDTERPIKHIRASNPLVVRGKKLLESMEKKEAALFEEQLEDAARDLDALFPEGASSSEKEVGSVFDRTFSGSKERTQRTPSVRSKLLRFLG